MTCIVGLVHKSTVYLGGDSAGVRGSDLTPRRDEKVFVKGPFIYGFAGSFRLGQILRYKFDPPAQDANLDDHAYLATDYLDTLRQMLERNGFLRKDNEVVSTGGIFLVGYRRNLYAVEHDFQVAEFIDEHFAIGSGSSYALGSLYTTKDLDLPPKERLSHALVAAGRYCTDVCAPYVVKHLDWAT